MPPLLTRRRFIALGAAACAGAFIDMCYLEPRWLRTARVGVQLPRARIARPIRILHLSDMHASDEVPVSFIREAFELGLAEQPDLVCLTGDFFTRKIPDRDDYIASLKQLSGACPCYACPGNHDGGSWVGPRGGYADTTDLRELLREANVSVLYNSSETITVNGSALELVGLGDCWANEARPQQAFPASTKAGPIPRIVLSHNPDSKELLQDHPWDLMLCGHTHGGQLSLPLIGTPFAPVNDQRYVYGLNEWNGRMIYTTRGIGNILGARFHCQPEVALVTIA